VIPIDTTNILFICGGAFDGIDKIIEGRIGKKLMGFGAEIVSQKQKDIGSVLEHIQPKDLIKFGLIPEFVGRLPIIVTMSQLDKSALIKILTEPKNALVKQYQRLFEMDDVILEITDDALDLIAEKAIARSTGARGLRTILENLMVDVMFDIPSDVTAERCIITRETVEKAITPEVTRNENKKPRKKVSTPAPKKKMAGKSAS
jgi:ATP-dependent Clp protease ATP-binding subunit ClpX